MVDLGKYINTLKKLDKGTALNFTFEINGKTYFFKTVATVVRDKIVEYDQGLIEVLVSDVLQKVGVKKFVEYEFARCKEHFGAISKSFITNDTLCELELYDILSLNYINAHTGKRYSINTKVPYQIGAKKLEELAKKTSATSAFDEGKQYSLSVDDLLRELKIFCENYHIKYDHNKLAQDLCEMVVTDYFCCNDDRNVYNVTFLLKKNHNLLLETAPIYDNGYAFGVFDIDNQVDDCLRDDKGRFRLTIGISDIGTCSALSSKFLQNGGVVAADIYALCKKSPTLNKIVQNFLQINMADVLEKFEVENNFKIEKKYRRFAEVLFNDRVQRYQKIAARLDRKLDRDGAEPVK